MDLRPSHKEGSLDVARKERRAATQISRVFQTILLTSAASQIRIQIPQFRAQRATQESSGPKRRGEAGDLQR